MNGSDVLMLNVARKGKRRLFLARRSRVLVNVIEINEHALSVHLPISVPASLGKC